MDELINIASYTTAQDEFILRVNLTLSEVCLSFEVSSRELRHPDLLVDALRLCKRLVSFDKNYFDEACGGDRKYFGMNNDIEGVERFQRMHNVTDCEGNPVKIVMLPSNPIQIKEIK